MCSTAFGLIKFSLESMPVIAFDVYVDPISLCCIFSSLKHTRSRSSSLWVQKRGFNLLPRLTATRLEAGAGCMSYFNYVAPNSCTRHEIHVIPWAHRAANMHRTWRSVLTRFESWLAVLHRWSSFTHPHTHEFWSKACIIHQQFWVWVRNTMGHSIAP